MSSTLRIGALQLRAHDRHDFSRRFPEIETAVRCAAEGLNLLVLPEGTLPAYALGDHPRDDDAEVEAALASLASVARERGCAIVVGAAQRRGGKCFNSAVALDRDGTRAGSSDKRFLWHFDRRWFSAGEALAPIALRAGSVGLMVCADGRMPGIGRALVDRGAQLLVMPTAWVTSGRNQTSLENLQADLLARVRAFENDVPFIAANKCGVERSMVAYCGKSQIVAPDGTVLAIASAFDEELIVASVDLRAPNPQRSEDIDVAVRDRGDDAIVRVVFSHDSLPSDIAERCRELDADIAVAFDDAASLAQLDARIPTVVLDAGQAMDPGYLIAFRRAGYRCAVILAEDDDERLESLARARAAELRLYVFVRDRASARAYVVDPDGTVIAGTLPGFSLPMCTIDRARTDATTVAPGTDVATGLDFIASIVERELS